MKGEFSYKKSILLLIISLMMVALSSCQISDGGAKSEIQSTSLTVSSIGIDDLEGIWAYTEGDYWEYFYFGTEFYNGAYTGDFDAAAAESRDGGSIDSIIDFKINGDILTVYPVDDDGNADPHGVEFKIEMANNASNTPTMTLTLLKFEGESQNYFVDNRTYEKKKSIEITTPLEGGCDLVITNWDGSTSVIHES